MTRVDFYVQAQDRLDAARRVCVKAHGAGARVLVLTRDALATERVSRHFWSVPSTGFLPHCAPNDRLAPVTPILVGHEALPLVHQDVLVNLSDEVPAFFSRFGRVIEIVTAAGDDRAHARDRFRAYRAQGHSPSTVDLSAAQAGGRAG